MSVPTSPLSPISSNNPPLSPSALPDLAIIPTPLSSSALPVGQLVSKAAHLNPTSLSDKHYDDIGVRWYKDVILLSASTGKFTASLGGTLFLQNPLEPGTEVGTIEAEEMRVRLLKDPEAGLKWRLQSAETTQWIKEQSAKGDIGFVTAVREVSNASYKRAKLVEAGNGNWEVVREVGSEGSDGKRRASGLPVETGSKRDIVGVVVRKIIVDGEDARLGDEMGTEFWN